MPRVESQCVVLKGWVEAEMIQVFATHLLRLWEALGRLEEAAKQWGIFTSINDPKAAQTINNILNDAQEACESLALSSASKQVRHIRTRLHQGTLPMKELADAVVQLRIRIFEDLDDKVFFCINDASTVQRFFAKNEMIYPRQEAGCLFFKSPEELIDPVILKRFPSVAYDVDEMCRSYVVERYSAAVFHATRVVEIGLLHAATIAGITDPKPSWGAVLKQLEKYAFKTEYDALPASVKPHRDVIRSIIPRMQGVQHAWRNKVDHATLIPLQPFGETDSLEILAATEALMRALATELP